MSQHSTDPNMVGSDRLWPLACFCCPRRSQPAISRLLHLHIPELVVVFPLAPHCSGFPLHNFWQGVTPGSNLEAAAHTHTKPKRRFPHLCVVLAFLSEHKSPQETAFCTEMCADISRTSEAAATQMCCCHSGNLKRQRWFQASAARLGAHLFLSVSYFLLPTQSVSPNRPKHFFTLLGCSLSRFQFHSCPARTWTPAAI